MTFNFPDPPLTVGQQVTNAATGIMYQWDGVRWLPIAVPLPSGVTVTVSDTAPATPKPGDLWFDSIGAQTYLYYQDPSSTQWVLTTSPPFPQAASFSGNVGRNLVHNSTFAIQQRGAGPWTASSYTADRWVQQIGGSTISSQMAVLADADRAALGDELAWYSLQSAFTGTSGAGDYLILIQPIENISRLANKTVTVSFWARYTSGTPKIGVCWSQNFGTGGSPSAQVVGTGVPITITGTWARYSVTFSLPSAAGKTFGTNGNNQTSLEFWLSHGSTYASRGNVGVQSGTVQFWGVQLEIGSGFGFPTPLEKVDIQTDLARCQRFFCVQNGYIYGFANNATQMVVLWTYPVQMRAAPAISFFNANPAGESPPWNTARPTSGATLTTGHQNNPVGSDIMISGFSGMTGYQPASLVPGCLSASADL